jgi:hypothetical protein
MNGLSICVNLNVFLIALVMNLKIDLAHSVCKENDVLTLIIEMIKEVKKSNE